MKLCSSKWKYLYLSFSLFCLRQLSLLVGSLMLDNFWNVSQIILLTLFTYGLTGEDERVIVIYDINNSLGS